MIRLGLVAALVGCGAPAPKPQPIVQVATAADGDRDHDTLPDRRDACPGEAEDLDGFRDADGCPDPDNDGDGILDVEDLCPIDVEDLDSFEDRDGCPDVDNDKDRIVDADDKCPNEPETYNGVDDDDGCPDTGRVLIHHPPPPPRILFAAGSVKLDHNATVIVKVVGDTLVANPQVLRVRVVGHAETTERNGPKLAKARATAVVNALVKQGIARDRLVIETGTESQRHITLEIEPAP
jgi:OOP family OmpA-OmpF porin